MGLWLNEIQKAKERSAGLDLRALADYARDKTPAQLSTPEQLAERKQFLDESLRDPKESQEFFERIIAGNELQSVNYLARGARAARAVSRIVIRTASGQLFGYGTGFLIAPRVIITNHHVLENAGAAARSTAQFEYEADIDGQPLKAVSFSLEPTQLFFTSAQLDFTVVAVAPTPDIGQTPLSEYGCLPLVGSTGKVVDGEWLTIIQHPNGERKQVCVRENKLIKRDTDVLWYSTDTLGGSSGSPTFNNDWYVVALHHSGVPLQKDGRIQTISGQDYDPARHGDQDIKWIANEGIRVSRIVETLSQALPTHPLLQPIFRATPASARILPDSVDALRNTSAPVAPIAPVARLARATTNARHAAANMEGVANMDFEVSRTVTVTLEIDRAGGARVVAGGESSLEAAAFAEARKTQQAQAPFDVPFDATYASRKGYDEDFLGGGNKVYLPEMQPALAQVATRLIKPAANADPQVLKYHNYSVVMHSKRRFAIYSAANVDFGGRFDMSRPPDQWREDPRIPLESQVSGFYYKKNQFDRGHLTRREDLEFGRSRKIALQSAADTCHWTNCTPQHAKFNQNKELWQGVERHVLEASIEADDVKAQVITGPVLQEDDPVWERFKEIQYPLKFWKVVAAINGNNQLFATAYLLDQSEVVDQFGIEAVPVVPFTAFKTFQVPITEVERLTNLLFHAQVDGKKVRLSEFDPLKSGAQRRPGARRRRPGAEEAAGIDVPIDYVLLESLEDVVRG